MGRIEKLKRQSMCEANKQLLGESMIDKEEVKSLVMKNTLTYLMSGRILCLIQKIQKMMGGIQIKRLNTMKIKITESQYSNILKESYYDSDKLYSKKYITSIFKKSPPELKRIVYNLEVIDCVDGSGNLSDCVKLPEVLFTYINGRY